MIRRDPTLIQMTDSDVQDIRDLVNKEKLENITSQQTYHKLQQMAATDSIQREDLEFIKSIRTKMQQRDTRLGV